MSCLQIVDVPRDICVHTHLWLSQGSEAVMEMRAIFLLSTGCICTRIIKVGKDLWDHLVQSLPCPLNHVPQCHIHTFLEHLQGQWLHHLPGQPIPIHHHSFSEEIFLHIQSELPVVQLEAIHSHPITATQEKRPAPASLQSPFRESCETCRILFLPFPLSFPLIRLWLWHLCRRGVEFCTHHADLGRD